MGSLQSMIKKNEVMARSNWETLVYGNAILTEHQLLTDLPFQRQCSVP